MPAVLQWLLRLVITNPICVRLVQGGSRRKRHLYIRTAYLAALMLVLLWSLLAGAHGASLSYRDLAAAGATSFKYTAYLQIGLICLLAPVFMAGAIAQEASPRTWDILLSTPLSAAQIVLGNLFGRLFFVLALLFASLPLFAVTQYFGGAAGSSIFASYAIAACAALLVGSIAVTLSVSRLAGRRAVFAFYIAVVSYLAATWAIDLMLRGPGHVTVLTALNPFLALESMLDPAAYAKPEAAELAAMGWLRRLWLGSPVATWCIVSTGLSLVMAGASAGIARRVGASGGTSPLRRILRPRSAGTRTRTPRHVWNNPIAWREAAARAGTLPKIVARWSFIAAGLLWGLLLLVALHIGKINVADFRFALLATTWTELTVISLIAINMAGSAISREREDGTLDLLLITPVTAGAYLGGKLRGLISFLAPLIAVPVVTVALPGLYVLMDGLGGVAGAVSADPVGVNTYNLPIVLPEAALVAPLVCTAFVAFCVMVGLQWSLRSQGTISSVIAAFGVIAVLSGVLGSCGWKAGQDLPHAGPAIACLNPASALFILINPGSGAEQTLVSSAGDLGTLRGALLIGAFGAAAAYAGVVYAMHASMVRTFDMTVRKLAGLK
ncbi:MAG: hypothetical protein VYC34_03990 [Planctomycetota bacterium]|nr:hypothetical protein [Planctomycetota bacterium]